MNKTHPKNILPLPRATYGVLMGAALDQARQAFTSDEVPVGALVVDPFGAIIGTGHNSNRHGNDPSLHAELTAIRNACRVLQTDRLDEHTLVSTLEPCAMCAGAVINARLRRVVFAAWDPRAGAAGSALDVLRNRSLPHQVEVIGGIEEERSVALLKDFFAAKRDKNKPSIC